MSKGIEKTAICAVCQKTFPLKELVSASTVRDSVAAEILKECPTWNEQCFICWPDLNKFRSRFVHSLVESEKGELSDLEQEVVKSLLDHDLVSKNAETEFEQKWTFAEKLADKIAAFGGSWKFLISFGLFITLWISFNVFIYASNPLDPYPFILLNLVLSCVAAIQAPVIMMSQNRQEAKDRLRSQQDYQVNLKAELEIRNLNEKLDHLLSHQWERLTQIQEIQLEVLAELGTLKRIK